MDNLVSPIAPQVSQGQKPVGQDVTPESDSAAPAVQLPPSLTKVPAIQGLIAGAPPAVSARIAQFKDTEVGKEIAKNHQALLAAGFAFYKSRHGDLAVMYNRFHIHGEDIKAADKAGKLQVLAPPFEQVDHALAKNGGKHMVGRTIPQGFATPTPQAAPQTVPDADGSQQASQSPQAPGAASSALENRLLGARLTALQPGAPTSGPSPGAGRLLNSILKPVV